jgi:hypothetical protein
LFDDCLPIAHALMNLRFVRQKRTRQDREMIVASSKAIGDGQLHGNILFRTFCLDTKSTQKVKAEKCFPARSISPPRFSAGPTLLGFLFENFPKYLR